MKKTKEAIALELKQKASELNSLINKAYAMGLKVKINGCQSLSVEPQLIELSVIEITEY